MSDAPPRMASRSILFTYLTMGASSTSLAATTASSSCSPPSVSTPSRSASSRSPIEVSCESRYFSMASRSLASSTNMASVLKPVLNLISSSAWILVGSETAIKRRLPRLYRGSALCFRISFSSTTFSGIISGRNELRSSTETPNSMAAEKASPPLFARLFCTRYVISGMRLWDA